ncbi:hypothetical protein WJX81_007705 [Elliptochloris bilobata]|uniref:Uncharacterized protein n=1 Tax=Elliptochloris bilobata TaxID=381761 RepID=A0AAW1RM76_9CHLO
MRADGWARTALLTSLAVATVFLLACWLGVPGSSDGGLAGATSQKADSISVTVTPASSVRCNRISLPARFYNATTSPYNPAATRHPVTGEWLLLHTLDEVTFTLSDMVRNSTNLRQLLNTHPLLLKLGRWNTPTFRRSQYKEVAMLEYDSSYLAAAREAGATFFKCGDWRPFVWRDAVYLAHWIYYGRGEERMAISAPYERTGRVRLAHVLSPLPPAVAAAARTRHQAANARAESLSAVRGSTWAREKNWGLVEDRGALLVFHVLLPCTVVLALGDLAGNSTAVGASARVASRACFVGGAAAAAEATGLDILRHPIHGSGNPVPWDIEHGAKHRELLGMLHVKQGDYAHWAVRIGRATRRVTHISAGPVLKARDYGNEGFLDSALVVGSFHVVDRMGEEGPERAVRILYGEGDRFGCWVDVAAEAIVWHAIGEPDVDVLKSEAGVWGLDLWFDRGVVSRPAEGGTADAGAPSSADLPARLVGSTGHMRAMAHGWPGAARHGQDPGRRSRDARKDDPTMRL